ncbi:MAG: DUF2868 domain-containing protein [Burkholderiaceae bacterium]
MNEQAARDVLLVRAVESADPDRTLITEADRQHAGRAAAELARWSASERGEAASAERFVEKRAELLLGKLGERERRLAQAVRSLTWRPWIGVLLPLAALAFGAFFQQVGERQHINVLAFPLLTIVLWNIIVLLVLAARTVLGLGRGLRPLTGLRGAVVGFARRAGRRLDGTAGDAFAAFMDEWTRAGAPLLHARAARVLHLSAALLAVGAIGGLYVRGLVFEYRAGWESTFLAPPQVHALLSSLLAPAAAALGQPFPGVEELARMRWPDSTGENAARWIHWYAVLVAALVVVPRLALAAWARWREQRLSRRFPIRLDEPYFRRLLGGFSPERASLRAVPYSYTLDEASLHGLREATRALLGDHSDLAVRPSVAFGQETAATAGLDLNDRTIGLTVALFSLASTPEHENHGAFLDTLRDAVHSPLIALVDEAPYKRRLGEQSAARDRLNERRHAWSAFCSAHHVNVAFVDLATPDLAQLERDAEPVLVPAA